MTVDHLLERRAKMLAGRIQTRKQLVKDAVAPAGTRPPFSQQMSKPQALRFWREHRYDEIGKKVLKSMDPESVLELDQALTQATEAEIWGPSALT